MKYCNSSQLQAILVQTLVALCSPVLSEHYYLTPVDSTDSVCIRYQNGICLTLNQLAQSNLMSGGGTNLTLSFLPGEHMLTQSLAIHNFTYVQIRGMNESVVSICPGKSQIVISHCDKFTLKNVYFIQHDKAAAGRSQQKGAFNCSLLDEYDEYKGSATIKISVARSIILNRFKAKGSHGRVVNIESSCDVSILDSEFTGNVGNVVYINSTNTVISDSKFDSNTGQVLTINSVNTFITQCNITNNFSPYSYFEFAMLVHIIPRSSFADSKDSHCSVPSSYSVMTHDTAIRKEPANSNINTNDSLIETSCMGSMNNSMADLECDHSEVNDSTQNDAVNNTTCYCLYTSSVPASALRNISNANDIIYDFRDNTSSSHGNRGMLCVNTDHRHTLPFTNRMIYCDNRTKFVALKYDAHNQDNMSVLTSEKVSGACSKNFCSEITENEYKYYLYMCTNSTNSVLLLANDYQVVGNSIINDSKVVITSCTFTNNTSQYDGGALYIDYHYLDNRRSISNAQESVTENTVLITSCSFTNNTSNDDGGAISIYSGSQNVTVHITFCAYTNNTSQSGGGGAISMINSNNILITSCTFTENTSRMGGGAITLNVNSFNQNVLITSCSFTNNTSQNGGGAISIYTPSSNVLITSCSFTNNVQVSSSEKGSDTNGAGACTIFIASGSQESVNTNVLITSCSFTNNTSQFGGGALYIGLIDCGTYHSILRIAHSEFINNSAHGIRLVKISNATVEQSNFINNENSVFYLQQSTVMFLSGNHFSDNNGSVYALNSKIEFKGHTTFSNNYHSAVIYAVQSKIYFNSPEGMKITNNTASLGGGIFLSESTMNVQRPTEISQNTADYGGGIYAYLSSIEFTSEEVNKQIMIAKNIASQSGGGICAIASTIKISRSFVNIDSNTALVKGGGMYLEQNTRVTVLKQEPEENNKLWVKLKISNNSAQFGGGIFLEDKAAGGSLCNGSFSLKSEFASVSPECFLQTIKLYGKNVYHYQNFWNTFISNNVATISGGAIYGGLFDRCTVSLQAEGKEFASNGLDYLSNTVIFINNFSYGTAHYKYSCGKQFELITQPESKNYSCFFQLLNPVSSEPVQVMFCSNQTIIQVMKGDSFRVHVAAVDQVGNPVNATIHASVITKSGVGRLKGGQVEQIVGNQCTELEYNVFSQDSSAQVELYAIGPCSNLGKSKQVINISFLPCTCPIGLQQSKSTKIDCECMCDLKLEQYTSNCSRVGGVIELIQETDVWIGIATTSNGTGYIINDCPFDYCVEKSVNISLSSSQERDRQCAFNRSGVLCGQCQEGLSLVLATSNCIKCSDIYLLLLIPFTLAGILLVAFILFFNITVASGTVHGLIFSANVLAANKPIFLPFTTPNFLTVFISWVNLDLGS